MISALKEMREMIIMPPRDTYVISDLGPCELLAGGLRWKRQDFELKSSQGHALACSHFLPDAPCSWFRKTPCVVYLHGMGSCRLEALTLCKSLLEQGIGLFCFDFAGCGMSGGKYMSLGFHEQLDVKVAVDYLWASGRVNAVALWGRSMGAATAILRAAEDTSLSACVLDSPFSDLPEVICEIVSAGPVRVPWRLTKLALRTLRKGIQKQADFDPFQVSPIRAAPSAAVPAYFIVSEQDTVVVPRHGHRLRKAWGTKYSSGKPEEPELTSVCGEHNDTRPVWLIEDAIHFLKDCFKGFIPLKCSSAPQMSHEWNGETYEWRYELDEKECSAAEAPGTALDSTISSMQVHADRALQNSTKSMKSLRSIISKDCIMQTNLLESESAETQEHRSPLLEGNTELAMGDPILMEPNPFDEAAMSIVSTNSDQSTVIFCNTLTDKFNKENDAGATRFPELVMMLLELGFDLVKALEAGKHCSTLENAVDWLEDNGHL